MKKIIKSIIMLLSLSLLAGCAVVGNEGGIDGRSNDNASVGEYKIKATVNGILDGELEVTATEDEKNAFGPYRALTNEKTKYYGKDGESVSRDNIKTGDVIEILYNGQVMRSYPPQIVAISVIVVG